MQVLSRFLKGLVLILTGSAVWLSLFPSLENHTTISLQKYTTYQCKVNVFFSLLKERCFNAQESALSCALKAGARDRLNAFNMKYINRLTISLFLLHDKTFHSY